MQFSDTIRLALIESCCKSWLDLTFAYRGQFMEIAVGPVRKVSLGGIHDSDVYFVSVMFTCLQYHYEGLRRLHASHMISRLSMYLNVQLNSPPPLAVTY